jgi:glutathionylspermidine synthase
MTLERKMVDVFFTDYEGYKADFVKTKEAVAHSKAIYKGQPVPYLYIPKLYDKEDTETFEYALKGIHNICKKTIDLYLEKEGIRKLFDFDERLDALIRMPHSYETTVPMGRFDIFYYGPGDFQFCELNADGASAMNEDHELSQILLETKLTNHFKEAFSFDRYELFHSWVSEVKSIYADYLDQKAIAKGSQNPTVAILDFIDKGSSIEFEVFKEAFLEDGLDCVIVDPRDLICVDGTLFYGKIKIDIVYRRLVTKDLMDRYDEIPQFIQGLKAGKTCVIGPIKTQIIHTKRFFEVLYEPELRQYLNEDEIAFIDKHVPYTRPLKRDDAFEMYLSHRDNYIIKPIDYYASKGVCAGKDYDDVSWKALLEEKILESFIIQKYCPLALVDNLYEAPSGHIEHKTFSTITGLFTYNEKLSGVYVRAGLNAIISGLHDGYTMSTLIYKEK